MKWNSSGIRVVKALLALGLISGVAGNAGVARAASLLDEIKSQFNKEKKVPRLILLVSPT